MSAASDIEWTDATWNPTRGCRKISPGCKNCYAETFAERFRGVEGHPYEDGFDPRMVPAMRPGGLLHALGFLAWALLPERLIYSWRWFRRCYGGRWALGPDGRRWRPVAACPGQMWAELLGGGPVPLGVCYEADGLPGECHCEVWP